MEPMKHEIEAARIMSEQSRCLLFDEMGVGKTVSTLLTLKRLKERHTGSFKAIICVPNTIVGQWLSEVETWLSWSCICAVGPRSERETKYHAFENNSEYSILITTYGYFVKDEFFDRFMADVLILDEGWIFRNRNTKLHCQLKLVIPKYDKCYLLSGNFESFNDRQFYSLVDLMFPDQFVLTDKVSLSQQLGDQFIFRKLGELSDAVIPPFAALAFIDLACTHNQLDKLDKLAKKENIALRNGIGAKALRHLNNAKLRVLLSPRISNLTEDRSPKENYIITELTKTDAKVVIYCSDRKFFDVLKTDLPENQFVCVSGSMSTKIRARNIGIFQNDPKCRCLLLSGVGKFGLSLQCATRLIFATVPKSKFEMDQVIGRLLRVTQDHTVFCDILYMKDTCEEDAVRLLKSN